MDDVKADPENRSRPAAFALRSPRDRSRRAVEESAVSSSSGSVFVPSVNEG